ncbi:MAPK regulated corepressor interacting protein 2-like [Mya arenaria]|uniref:MAPK regulated corepressor interacting protein 2-like n=1 Tax=Mya arenaria TaxID=6604 RepID=UPI0022E95B66|nr:MAPK regulated corepressor interacting protein 2-like [Mya arenaria]
MRSEQMGRGMYALPNRPSKFVANARIGPSKTLNNLEIARSSPRDTDKQQTAVVMSSPKPVFNGTRGRHQHYMRRNSSPSQPQYSVQHEEIVKILSEGWSRVNHELEKSSHKEVPAGPILYREKNPNPKLNDFKAFDLEKFWGDRLYAQATGSPS